MVATVAVFMVVANLTIHMVEAAMVFSPCSGLWALWYGNPLQIAAMFLETKTPRHSLKLKKIKCFAYYSSVN